MFRQDVDDDLRASDERSAPDTTRDRAISAVGTDLDSGSVSGVGAWNGRLSCLGFRRALVLDCADHTQ